MDKELFEMYIYHGIFGVCIGDAVGVPYEFKSYSQMKQKPATDMIGYGTHYQPVGTWSDDSSLTLCLAHSIAHTWPQLDYNDIMNRFTSWFKDASYTATNDLFDCGRTCGLAILQYVHGCDPILCGGYNEQSNGNGSLMRILPLAFYIQAKYPNFTPNDETMQWIDDISSLTHRHKRSVIACGIYICIALEIMKCGNLKKGILQGILNALVYYETKEEYRNQLKYFSFLYHLDKSLQKPETEIPSGGYVVETLEAAIWALMSTDNYKDAILRVINLGHDTDTTAAVAGGLAGLAYGVPLDWMEKLQRKDFIAAVCYDLAEALK